MRKERIIYTPAEIAQLLGVKTKTVYDMLHQGEIPSIKIGRNFKIPKELFDRWLCVSAKEQAEERKTHYGQEKRSHPCG